MDNKVMKRGAGVLMPVSSLPSDYGIGSLGEQAYRFADWLMSAGQKYWQVLPVGPTGFGDSPYQSFSAFAGNPYFIDLGVLAEEGLVKREEIEKIKWFVKEDEVDYESIFNNRFAVLKKAFDNSKHKETMEYKQFCWANRFWLEDYSLFMALKEHFNNREWLGWDEDIRFRRKPAMTRYSKYLSERVDFFRFCQFKFYEQWKALKKYVNGLGIKIIGDIPLYVSLDSADVWSQSRLFELDENLQPTCMAGVPPDCFSEDGQLWGNPIYNWKVMEREHFKWWRKRIQTCSLLYDVIRIDHFIGIRRYYSIPAGEINAKKGKWCIGPGRKLTKAITTAAGEARLIAEDLGVIVPEVRKLIEDCGWPGMKVLEFAFDGSAKNEYLPHNYTSENCVVYGGTHDNETIMGFVEEATEKQLKQIYRYLGVNKPNEVPKAMIRLAYSSIARTAVFQMQDILGLGKSARMNTPATIGDNWRWRLTKNQINDEDAKWLFMQARIFGR